MMLGTEPLPKKLLGKLNVTLPENPADKYIAVCVVNNIVTLLDCRGTRSGPAIVNDTLCTAPPIAGDAELIKSVVVDTVTWLAAKASTEPIVRPVKVMV